MSTEPRSSGAGLVCHCMEVPYSRVDAAIDRGRVLSLADVQRETGACTRCFGCRFELERLLHERLGERYVPTAAVTRLGGKRRGLLARFRRASPPRRMYMPFLNGYSGSSVTTRIVVFNMATPEGVTVEARLDLLGLSGERVGVHAVAIKPGASAVVRASDFGSGAILADGVGAVKMVVDSGTLHSLRPYFQFVSPAGVTITHEKAGPVQASDLSPRPYHWLFPVGFSPTQEEAYFFCTNTQEAPMSGQRLVWQDVGGDSAAVPLPELGLDGSAFVALHEPFPAVASGAAAGTVRLDPARHKVAGFMLRHDRRTDTWRVQHL